MATVIIFAQLGASQVLELDENGQERWRYSFDYAHEVALARAHAQAQAGKESAFQSYTEKINNLEALAQQLQALQQGPGTESEIAAKYAELHQKISEITPLIQSIVAPEESQITHMARVMFGQ